MLKVKLKIVPARLSERFGANAHIAILAILIGSLLRVPALSHSVIDRFGFRQAQTAMVVREFMREGFDWRTPLPVFGPESLVPFEFPAFQALAAGVGNVLGLSATMASRSLGFLFFQLSAVLIFLILRSAFSSTAATTAIVLSQTLPFGLQYAHASLIEFMPVALMLCATLGLLRAKRMNVVLSVIVLCFVVLAALAKVTTAITLMPLLLVGPLVHSERLIEALRSRRGALAVLSAASAAVAAGVWTLLSDSIKAAAVETRWLTSAELVTWNFGTIRQRLEFSTWQRLHENSEGIFPFSLIVVVLFVLLILFRREGEFRRLEGLLLISCLIGPLFFINLYYVHDYYFSAIFFPGVALYAIIFHKLVHRFSLPLRPAIATLLVTLSLGLTLFGSDDRGYAWALVRDGREAFLVSEIRMWTVPSELVVLVGCDWDPTTAFLADRSAYMVRPPGAMLPVPASLQPSIGGIGACDPQELPTPSDLYDLFPGMRFIRTSEVFLVRG